MAICKKRLERILIAFPEVTVSIVKKPKKLEEWKMSKNVQNLRYEIDSVNGEMLCLVESFDALQTQVGWTHEKFVECFHADGSLNKDNMVGFAYGLKTDVTNILNLICHLNTKLQQASAELNKVDLLSAELANEIVNKKSPQTECNQSKA